MHVSKKIVLALISLSFVSCASEMGGQLPITVQDADPGTGSKIVSSPLIADPGQGLKSMLEEIKAGNNDAALLTAYKIADQYPRTPWYRRSLFLIEQVMIQMDRPSEADAAMLRIKMEYPVMADYAIVILADYHYSKKRYTQAAALYENLIQNYPKSSLAGRAAYRLALSLHEAYAYDRAAEVFERFLKDYPGSEFASDAAIGLARALLSDFRTGDAAQAFRDVRVKYPGTSADQEALKELTLLSGAGITIAPWSSDELYGRAKNFYRASQYDKAIEAFAELLARDPGNSNRAEALFRTGIAQFNVGKRGEATAVLEKMIRDYPRDERVPEALYWIGKSYFRLSEREKSHRMFQKIINSHRNSEWADDALFLTGNVYREAGDTKKSASFYARLASEYPASRFADSALWWIAWGEYQAGENQKAEQKLQELINAYPRSFLVHQARYWQGKIAERTGDIARAVTYYNKLLKHGRYTYYGYRAEERLARLTVMQTAGSPVAVADVTGNCTGACLDDAVYSFENDEGPPVWTEETRQLLTADPSFRKTLELMHLEMKREAASELWNLQGRLPRKRGALIGLSKAFFELGDYYRSLMLVLKNYERYLDGDAPDASPDLWLLAYPQGYWDTISAYSQKYGQDPYFIAAIIRQESQFHPEALSPAGARGVMQVMPSTGEWVARNIRMAGFERAKLFESDTAINIGTWYISHLMKRLKGDPLFVAAAYNAGPEAVSGWVGKINEKIDRDEFVESIPYAETRGYVKKVLRNYFEYRRLYSRNVQDRPHLLVEDQAIMPVLLNELVKPQ